ncbi:MAG: cytochrome c biogenesis protein ResB [Thermoflexales bacterium]|nr:cytochrome c biogenesis protein ResB [Thermoflexales bacterium]
MTTASPPPPRDLWQRVWHTLADDRWLAMLLLALAGLLLAAALLPQTPQIDPVAYSRWLSEAQQRFGSLTAPLTSLGLFAVTHSIGFRLLMALLAMSSTLRLIETLDRWRALRHFPDRPTRPTFDRVAGLDRAAVQTQLRGWRFQSDNDLICAERHQRRSTGAAMALSVGSLVVLIGLALATVTDTRTENIVVEPGAVTPIPGTPYVLRLDALVEGRATVAVLNEGQSIGQGELADRQPVVAGGVSIYLRETGPALIVTAARGDRALGLQSTVDSPPQPEKLLSFTPDRSEVFVAAPDAEIVLQLTWLSDARYTAQALQMATGKVLASREIAPGEALSVGAVAFTLEPAAFMTVTAAQQPAHWLILPGWVLINLGVLGTLLWRASRVWLEVQDNQTRVLSADTAIDPAVLKLVGETPIGPLRPTVARVASVLWLIWTLALSSVATQVYVRAASLEANNFRFNAALGAWLLWSGAVVIRPRRWRAGLVVLGLILAALAFS